MPLVFRDEKGADLTAAEVDGNFRHLRDDVQSLVDNPPLPVSVGNITETATTFTVWLDNGTPLGPFQKPVAMLRYRGAWQAETGYFENDLFTHELAGLYFVTQDHVSDTEFDPDAETTDGPLYQLVIGPFTISTGVLAVSGTAYFPELSHVDRYVRCSNVLGCEVVVPNNSTRPFAVGSELHFRQGSDGPISFTAASGVTINGIEGFINETGGRGSVVTLKKVGTNLWDLFGRLAEDEEATA